MERILCGLGLGKGYKRNINLYPIFRFFNQMMIIGPVLVPFMLLKGLSYTEIMMLQSIAAISLIVFEVPTGAISDKMSRKYSLVLGALLPVVSLIFYIIFTEFWLFAVAEILFGLGFSFASGTDTSILYESLKCVGKKKDYQRVEGRAYYYTYIGQAVGSIVSSVTYTIGAFIPFWISVVNVSISAVLAMFFVDSNKNKSQHQYHVHVWKSMGVIWKSNRILWLVLFAGFMGVVMKASFWLYQPYFDEVNVDVFWFGFIFFGFNVVAALSSKYLVERYYDERPRKVMIALGFLMVATFIIPAILAMKLAIVVLALQQVARALYRPTQRFYVNHQIKDQYRATVHSMVSLVASLSFAIFSPLIGWALDNTGTIPTYFYIGVSSLAVMILLVLLRRYEKNKKILAKLT